MELQEPAITLAIPIIDKKEYFMVLLLAKTDINKIADIMVERSGLGETGETLLVNNFNYLVSPARFTQGLEYKRPSILMQLRNASKEIMDMETIMIIEM